MEKRQMIDALACFYTNGNKTKLARRLGIPQSRLSMWCTKNTIDEHIIYDAFAEISPDWLLTGEGSMFRDEYKPKCDKETRNRIFAFCTANGIDIADFDRDTNLTLEGIANVYPNLNPAWLLDGEGDMIIHKPITGGSDDIDRYRKRVEELERLLEQKDRMIDILMKK